ncbi:MAG: PQQ-dependent sugar dehydrogenase [Parcubacteria group bacterium]|nr:PQQ-dependent sugar dehydrogenase [Parcubacteria group bacterium]
MKHNFSILFFIVVLFGGLWVFDFYVKNLQGVWSALAPVFEKDKSIIEKTGDVLNLRDKFSIEILADGLPKARVLKFDNDGNIWVSQTAEGIISKISLHNGVAEKIETALQGLNNPHGLAFDPDDSSRLYVAEESAISAIILNKNFQVEKIVDLPSGKGHFTRTINFGPDGRLYVSVGSSCNVCVEQEGLRAAITSMKKDGSNAEPYAIGLRNAVFFTWHPKTDELWATEMGRDLLGDDTPPDEINIVRQGGNYGWPICYGKNIHDTNFDKNTYVRNPCMDPFEVSSYIDVRAHSAPLGLAFVPDVFVDTHRWPASYKGDLLVAYHGSWNRTEPTGYKIVRYMFSDTGMYEGEEDFITGWLTVNGKTLGRPVDVAFGSDGGFYISDDAAGVIYRVVYNE